VGGESLKIIRVGRQNGAAGFRDCDDDGVHDGATSRPPPQQRCSPSDALRNPVNDIASLEQLIGGRVAPGVTLKTLHQDRGRHYGRPKAFLTQGNDQRGRSPRPLR
jgi:hypothetical protein